MTNFIQLHLLTSYGASNLNRDDLGRPKSVQIGGTNRLRISSQSLKRAWRTSDLFEEHMGDYIGTRTKRLGVDVHEYIISRGASEKQAKELAVLIAGVFGKNKKDKQNPLSELEIEQLVHIGPKEMKDVYELVDMALEEDRIPTKDELILLRKEVSAVDIAMFGRMLASSPVYNIEAAAQVSHAVTVHKAIIEDDFFTAVDDLNNNENGNGSSHLGETGYSAGVFYTYICINMDMLIKNLGGDSVLAQKATSALITTATCVSPAGKQNSFASRARASYVLAEKGPQQPRQLTTAFLKPIDTNFMKNAISTMENMVKNMDKAYGACADSRYTVNVDAGNGTLAELVDFIAG